MKKLIISLLVVLFVFVTYTFAAQANSNDDDPIHLPKPDVVCLNPQQSLQGVMMLGDYSPINITLRGMGKSPSLFCEF